MTEQLRIAERLAELKQEQNKGQQALAELLERKVQLEQTLLRIGGAIQVLEELVNASPASGGEATPETETAGD